jgi:hypothetical protein
VTFVKVRLVGAGVRTAGVPTAEPVKGIARLGFEAFEVTVTVPVKLLAEGGVNVTVNEVLCPGVNVTGGVIPEILKPVPATLAAEIVALVPPEFVTVSVWLELWPTVTFVKVKLVGEAVKVAGVTAVALRGIDRLGFEAFEVTVTVPLNVPADVGANFTVNVVLCPGVRVTGVLIPEILNPVPVAVAAEIVALVPPVFVTVSV